MNGQPRAIMVCVEFDDLLALTLPSILPHVADLMVVTTPDDGATIYLATAAGAKLCLTDAFYARGAEFNKGAALEAGFDRLSREGWILVLDADIVLPPDLDLSAVERGWLWGIPRCYAPDPWAWGGRPWKDKPVEPLGDVYGYFQLFHADDAPGRPWYPTNYRSAATVDQVFSWRHFPGRARYLTDQSVLHLGPNGNWTGRIHPRQDGSRPAQVEARQAALNAIVAARLPNHDTSGELLT